jgi:hypothetical protein
MASQARGGRRLCKPEDGMSRRCRGLGNGTGGTTLWAQGEWRCWGTTSWAWGRCLRGRLHHQLRSGKMVARKRARPWSKMMARRLWGGLDDDAEAPGRTRWLCRGSGEYSMMARAPGRLMTTWALGKIWAVNFGILTAWVKASEVYGLQRPHNGLFIGEPQQQRVLVTLAGPLLLRITVATDGWHHRCYCDLYIYSAILM